MAVLWLSVVLGEGGIQLHRQPGMLTDVSLWDYGAARMSQVCTYVLLPYL